MQLSHHPSFHTLGITHSCHQSQISQFVPGIMQRCVGVALQQQLGIVCGYNMTLAFEPASQMVTFKAGIKTERLGTSTNEVEAFTVPEHEALGQLVVGSYDQIPQVIASQRQWFIDQGRTPGKLAYYLYLTNPATTPEAENEVLVVWGVE